MKYLAWVAAAMLLSFNAFGHHGPSPGQKRNRPSSRAPSNPSPMSPPHPVLEGWKAADGISARWTWEIRDTDGTLRVSPVEIREGRRHHRRARQPLAGEAGKKHMKAVRITVRERQFDVYPERIEKNFERFVLEAIHGRVAGRGLAAAVGDGLSVRQCRAHPGRRGVARRRYCPLDSAACSDCSGRYPVEVLRPFLVRCAAAGVGLAVLARGVAVLRRARRVSGEPGVPLETRCCWRSRC